MPPKAAVTDEQRQLKIKTGVVKRNMKDLLYSQKELTKEQDRLRRFIEEKDDDRIYQQKKVIQESESALPRSKERILSALKDLEEFMKRHCVKFGGDDGEEEVENKKKSGGGNKYDDFSDEEDDEGDENADDNKSNIDHDGEEAAAARATREEAHDLLASLV